MFHMITTGFSHYSTQLCQNIMSTTAINFKSNAAFYYSLLIQKALE